MDAALNIANLPRPAVDYRSRFGMRSSRALPAPSFRDKLERTGVCVIYVGWYERSMCESSAESEATLFGGGLFLFARGTCESRRHRLEKSLGVVATIT